MEWFTFIHEYIDKKNFEAIVMGWQLGRDPDNYAMWHSSQQKEGQYNFCGYENPQVDQWLIAARETFDPKQRESSSIGRFTLKLPMICRISSSIALTNWWPSTSGSAGLKSPRWASPGISANGEFRRRNNDTRQ